MSGKLEVIALSVLCLLGIITIPQYIHFMEGTIVNAVLICVFLAIIGGFVKVAKF
jgi:hypothetical protein